MALPAKRNWRYALDQMGLQKKRREVLPAGRPVVMEETKEPEVQEGRVQLAVDYEHSWPRLAERVKMSEDPK